MSKQKLKGLWIPAEILLNNDLSDKEKIILSMVLFLSSDSQKEPHTIGENDKDIINNIKNKNNYNKELQIKKAIKPTLNSEIILALTLLNYMQMQMLFYSYIHLHI